MPGESPRPAQRLAAERKAMTNPLFGRLRPRWRPTRVATARAASGDGTDAFEPEA